jgi:ABC-2 type transport system ATP-binding protein
VPRLRYIAEQSHSRPDMIETDKLTKRYGHLTAVDALSIYAEPGQVLGLLGPNGAGKTTAMRMIAGFLAPTAGTARIRCAQGVA